MKTEYLELIKKATELAKPIEHNRYCKSGHVASALIDDNDKVYTGVNIDTDCGLGFCAEHSAIAQMTATRASKIKAIVAVNHNGKILPPCGRCRELMYQINLANLKTEIIISETEILLLEDLLNHRWQEAW